MGLSKKLKEAVSLAAEGEPMPRGSGSVPGSGRQSRTAVGAAARVSGSKVPVKLGAAPDDIAIAGAAATA